MESIRRSDVFKKNKNIAGKLLTVAGFVLLGVVIWTVVSKAESAREKGVITLNMWDLPTTNISNPEVRAARAVHLRFLESHPDIRVAQTRGIRVEGPARESAFYMAMAGGTAPDLFAINMRSIGSYIDQGFVIPLDEFITTWPEAQERIADAVRPAISRTYIDENGKAGTHIYALPTSYYVMGFYYRKALFQEAGLPIDGCPPEKWNWDMLWEYGKKLTFPEEGHFGLTVPRGLIAGWMWMPFVWQADGDIVRQYGEDPVTGKLIPLPKLGAPESAWITPDGLDLRKVKHVWRAVYDERGGVEALEFYKKLTWAPWTRCNSRRCRGKNVCYDITPEMLKTGVAKCPVCGQEVPIETLKKRKKYYRGILFLDPTDIEGPFLREKRIGMMMWSAGGINVAWSNVDPDEIGLMPCPAGPRGTRANNYNASMWGINSQLKDPKKIKAAWEYIKFQASDEAQRIRVRTMVEAGRGRYVDPDLLKKYGFEEFTKYVPKTWAATYRQLKLYGRVEPYAPNYLNVQTAELEVPLEAVFIDPNTNPAKVLKESATKVNNTIFREIPADEMNRKRRIAYVVAAGVGVIVIFIIFLLAKSVRGLVEAAATRKRMGLKFSQTSVFAAWAFMVPAVATIFLWRYVPLIRGAVMAFMDYHVIGESSFVGLDNFILLFGDSTFWLSLVRTAFYVSLAIGFQFTAPIFLALLLAEVPRGKILYRIIYYLPAVTSGLVIMFLWKKFYDPSTGVFNTILTYFGFEKSQWLSSGKWWLPMVCVVAPMVWAGAGPRCLIYLAALKSVPEEMYEAADIDGASTLQKVWRITLPFLKPLIIINFVGAFIGAFQAMQQIFVMTGGGPARATHVIGLEIWYNAFMYLKFGYATAEAWLLGTMLIGFTVYQLQILKKVRFTTAKV